MMNAWPKIADPFDVLMTTATDLQILLQEGKISSVQIVETYQRLIEKYNTKLRAIINIAPNLKDVAQALDDERKEGGYRGPLHGIPIIVKVRSLICMFERLLIIQDAFNTEPSMGMPTTVGSFALTKTKVKKNANLIGAVRRSSEPRPYSSDNTQLLQQGLIIIGKAT
jgi:amidase